MGKIAKVDRSAISEAFQNQNNKENICALEENFNKLEITTNSNKVNKLQITTKPTKTDELQSKFQCLNLEDDDGKLIERGPPKDLALPSKDNKPKYIPYQTEKTNKGRHEIVSNIHNCGVTLYYGTEPTQTRCENCIDPSTFCQSCLQQLRTAYSEEFTDFLNILLDDHDQTQPLENTDTFNIQRESVTNQFDLNIEIKPSEANTTQCHLKSVPFNISQSPQEYNLPTFQEARFQRISYEYNIKPTDIHNIQLEDNTPHFYSNTEPLNISLSPPKNSHIFQMPRRISHDSGIGADIPSPLSDMAFNPVSSNITLSPMAPPPPPPSKELTIIPRKIRPKTPVPRRSPSGSRRGLDARNSKETSDVEVQKEILLSTLNADINIQKWVDYVHKGDTIFEVKEDGKTILHEILCIKQYLEEEFYTAIETMKRNPDKCKRVIQDYPSIHKEIINKTNNQVLADYFCEAIAIIQKKQQAQSLNT